MDFKQKTQRLMVMMDVLFDTRLSTLAIMDNSHAEKALANKWHDREGDFYETWIDGFDRNAFNEIYYHRGERQDVLTNSLVTNYLSRLAADLKLMTQASASHPMAGEVRLAINTYPYTLGMQAAHELVNCIQYYVGNLVQVDVIRVSIESMTPQYLRDNFVSFSVYEFDEWYRVHANALLDKPIPSVTCIAPRLLKKPLDFVPKMDPAVEISMNLVEHLALEWVPASNVSIII